MVTYFDAFLAVYSDSQRTSIFSRKAFQRTLTMERSAVIGCLHSHSKAWLAYNPIHIGQLISWLDGEMEFR